MTNTNNTQTQFLPLVVELAQDIWRLQSAITRLKQSDVEIPATLIALADRLQEDLTIAGVNIIDPIGQPYDHNARYDIVSVVGGNEDLSVSQTITPGIRIGEKLIARPKVALTTTEALNESNS